MATQKRFIVKNGLDNNSTTIINVADPVNAQDAVTKNYLATTPAFTGQIVTTKASVLATGGGQLYLNGATANRIDFNNNGIGAPAYTTRSVGTKILLNSAITSTTGDYAIGMDAATMWSSLPSTSASFKWYGGTTLAGSLSGGGSLYLANSLSMGVAASSNISFTIATNMTGGTTVYGMYLNSTIQAVSTAGAYYNMSRINTAATTFSTSNVYGYMARTGTIGAGSTITSLVGYLAENTLNKGTLNYGFSSNITANVGSSTATTITSISVTTNVVTITTTAAHEYLTNEIVTIALTDTAAGSFVVNQVYTITALGTTDFAAIGAAVGFAVGTVFTATGAGSGTGTATLNMGGSGIVITNVPTTTTFTYAFTNPDLVLTTIAGTVTPAKMYNFLAAGSAPNYFIGNVGIGVAFASGTKLLQVSSDALINGSTLGLGAGNSTTNAALGTTSLGVNTTGNNNTALGSAAMFSNTTGYNSTSIGRQSLYYNVSGYNNTALGTSAIQANTTGFHNTGIGVTSLGGNTTGYNNTGIGYNSGYSNTAGYQNTSIGSHTLYDVKPTSKAITAFADYSATFVGTTKATSVAHGLGVATTVLSKVISGTTNYNGTVTLTVIDADTFYINKAFVTAETSGWWSTALEGANNTAIGYNTGRGIISGYGNTIIGANVIGLGATLTNNIILADSSGNIRLRSDGSGNIGIGVTPSGTYKLEVSGGFAATTKSFLIDHPTKEGMQLRYGSLEGPENGVYIRGRLKDSNIIELPEYWTKLVAEDSITVNLTAIGSYQNLYVENIKDNTITIGGENINCFYTIFAERVDVEKLIVEIA